MGDTADNFIKVIRGNNYNTSRLNGIHSYDFFDNKSFQKSEFAEKKYNKLMAFRNTVEMTRLQNLNPDVNDEEERLETID